jgi:hypothetical protein
LSRGICLESIAGNQLPGINCPGAFAGNQLPGDIPFGQNFPEISIDILAEESKNPINTVKAHRTWPLPGVMGLGFHTASPSPATAKDNGIDAIPMFSPAPKPSTATT